MDVTDVSYAAYLATFLPGIIAFFTPLAASFFSREHLPSEVTAGLTVAFTAAGAFLTEFIQGGHYSIGFATLKAFLAYIIAAEARARVWANKPDATEPNLDDRLLAFPRKLPTAKKPQRYGGGVPDDVEPAA